VQDWAWRPPFELMIFLKKSYLHLQILIKSIFPLSITKPGISNHDITKFFVFSPLTVLYCVIFLESLYCVIYPVFLIEGGKSNFDIVELTVPQFPRPPPHGPRLSTNHSSIHELRLARKQQYN
jgi:hypothetical protein